MIEVIRFGAEWCQPCKRYTPQLEKWVNDKSNINLVLIDIEQEPTQAQNYGVMSVPYTVFKSAHKTVGIKGALTTKQLDKVLATINEENV